MTALLEKLNETHDQISNSSNCDFDITKIFFGSEMEKDYPMITCPESEYHEVTDR